MTQVTVKELAQEVEAPVERLLQQMREAGLPHTDAGQVVTDNEKQTLLTHLKSSHKSKAEEPRKITLQRKTTSTLRVAGSKSISVEVRKKKVFVQRSPEEIQAEQKRELEERRAAENAAREKVEAEVRQRNEEQARRQAAETAAAAPAPAAKPEAAPAAAPA
ncbi:translation initiation factor IF-2 associated domain-containing protein, partial [Pseudomonas asiatica]